MPSIDTAKQEPERRVTTILFADISGFTSMSERLEPEEVTDIMNACFERIGAVAESLGGVVDKYIGDCAMILFGAPRTVEGAPDKALRAAIRIRDAIDAVNAELKPPVGLRVHSGVNTGTVIAGRVGSKGAMSYTVMGDPVNVASRLKDAAEPGHILVGGGTRTRLREAFAFGPMRTINAKGKEGGIEAWELLSAASSDTRGGPVAKPWPRGLVGREKELELLERGALDAAGGRGSFLLLTGDAGIGKSRLVDALLASKAMDGCRALAGRCVPDGSKTSFHPFVEALGAWAREAPLDGAGEAAPFIARMLGLPLTAEATEKLAGMDGEGLERATYAGVRALLSWISAERPLVFIVEDIQWADGSSLELLAYCLRLVPDKRIVFLITARPDYAEARAWMDGVLEGYGAGAELRLAPLDAGASGTLVDLACSADPIEPALRRKIIDTCGGNPLFIEELVRSLPGGAELPSSIEEATMGRIDRLDAEARDVLKAVSVAGRSVQLAVLRETLSNADRLDACLRRLVTAGFMVEAELPDGPGYRFRDDLAYQVAYDSLVAGRRRELHLAFAGTLERMHAGREEEVAGLLALHCSRAGEYGKAEAWMVMAGERALRTAATNEAIGFYRDALELCVAKDRDAFDPARADLIEKDLARLLYSKGRYREALPYYVNLMTRRGLPELGSPAARIQGGLGWIQIVAWILFPDKRHKPFPPEEMELQFLQWEYSGMLTSLGDMKALVANMGVIAHRFFPYGVLGDESLLVGIVSISFFFIWSGRSLPIGARILSITKSLLVPDFAWARLMHANMSATLRLVQGDYSERWFYRDPAIGFRTDRAGLYQTLHLIYHACTMCIESGDWDSYREARAWLEDATERYDADVGRGCLENSALRSLLKRRDVDEAVAAIPRLVDFFARTGYQAFRAFDFSARVALMRGDLERAAAEYDRAQKAWAGHGGVLLGDGLHFGAAAALAVERSRRAGGIAGRGRVPARRDSAAVRRYLANSRKFAPDLPEALKFAGCLAWHSGRPRRAMRFWTSSVEEAERHGAQVELAHTLDDAGRLLGQAEPGPRWRERAAELYTRMGMGNGYTTAARGAST